MAFEGSRSSFVRITIHSRGRMLRRYFALVFIYLKNQRAESVRSNMYYTFREIFDHVIYSLLHERLEFSGIHFDNFNF